MSACSTERMTDAQDEVTQLLRQRHRIRNGVEDDFAVHNMAEIADMLRIVTLVMSLLLARLPEYPCSSAAWAS